MDRKTVIIGLDGGTFDLIDPLIKKGLLPNLEALMRFGSKGKFLSTTPPMTAPSWVSIATGNNPGKTGIFDFWTPQKNTYQYRLINYNDVKSPCLWNIASEFDKKTVIINYPVTYPLPENSRGTIISGMLTPSTDSDYTYPPSLKKDLLKMNIDYKIDAGWSLEETKNMDKFLNDILYCLDKRKKASLAIMDKKDWDLFTVVFTALDRIQHFFWHFQDENHPEFDLENAYYQSDPVAKVYAEIDNTIGELLFRIDRFCSLFIVSDHGFSPLHNLIYVNKILMDLGLLSVKAQYKDDIMNISNGEVDPEDLIHPLVNFDLIDWKKTLCFMPTETSQGLRLNVKGREPEGIIEQKDIQKNIEGIIESLKSYKDPKSNCPAFSHLFKKDEIYQGDYVDLAPDIVFLNESIRGLPITSLTSGAVVKRSSWRTGHHSRYGIFIAAGHHIKGNHDIEHIEVYDLAPTVLYSLGLPIPECMDGSIQFEIFKESFVKENPVRFLKDDKFNHDPDKTEEVYSKEDNELLTNRLKSLGYL